MNITILKFDKHAEIAPVRCTRSRLSIGLLVLLAAFCSNGTLAAHCDDLAGRLVSVEGDVRIDDQSASLGMAVCHDETIKVGSLSRAAVRLADTQTVVRIDQNSTFLIRPSDSDRSWLELLKGVIYLFSRQPESLRIDTAYVNAAIDGTEFVVEAAAEYGAVTVIEGSVLAGNDFGTVRLQAGEMVSADAERLPQRRVVVDPLDTVQWALYYPPIGPTELTSEAVRSASGLLARGDVERAQILLNDVAEDAASLALQAMIAVTQNHVSEARQLAEQAIATDPASSLAYTALSYAQQAEFEIQRALTSASMAVRNNPTNGYALARRSELELSIGESDAALISANRAIDVAPESSRAHTVLGFVRLVRLEIREAKAAFTEATYRDPGDPLPHLGLGLATIREGRLVQGRESLETAVALDPGNALVRSYLGKAYAEEFESSIAASQYALAQAIDPQDPTAWFYDAMLDQALNRPVSAYRKINKARALNDNRLVYRSRLLVDSDAASQSVGLARVYSDLGFEQLAINQSSQSLAFDPTNYSAYRFLADALNGRERHELARESVLFRSALLEPLTINPAQPEVQESDLLVLPGSGPVSASDKEFNPLFDRDGFRLNGSLVYGNQKTLSNQLVLAAMKGKVAYSIGQFHYESDGFRENNDLTHDLLNFQIQYQPDHRLSLQADIRARKSTSGDLLQSFDPDDLDPTNRLEVESATPRIGFRYTPNKKTTVLASLRSLHSEEAGRRIFETRNSGSFIESAKLDVDGLEPHLQLIRLGHRVNHTIGIEGFSTTSHEVRKLETNGLACGDDNPDCIFDSEEEDSRFINSYYYSDFSYSDSLTMTLGASHVSVDDDARVLDFDHTSPKLGLRWSVTPAVSLRTAFVKGVGRGSSPDLTLEPVIIAGFNHLFDDHFGTRYQSVNIALDWELEPQLSIGFESTLRQLKVPITLADVQTDILSTENEDQDEVSMRSYLYWLPSERDAVSASLSFELFDREVLSNPGLEGTAYYESPSQTTTTTLPVRWRHTRENGYFAQSTVTFVHQNIDESPLVQSEKDTDKFVYVELSAGKRFDGMRGSFTINVRNLFDTDFNFQDQSFVSSGRMSAPRFSTGRTIHGRMSFYF